MRRPACLPVAGISRSLKGINEHFDGLPKVPIHHIVKGFEPVLSAPLGAHSINRLSHTTENLRWNNFPQERLSNYHTSRLILPAVNYRTPFIIIGVRCAQYAAIK